MTVIKSFITDNKFEGFLVSADNGDTNYMTTKDFQNYLKNISKKLLVRLPNETIYDEINLDLEKFEISNEFDHEFFGWYDGTAISLKKF